MIIAGRTFTPVPKRVMDGSEDTEVLSAAVLSGAPMELQARTVRYVTPFCATLRRQSKLLRVASTNKASLPPSPVTGVRTSGVWTGIFCPRATDGRTR
jgi:hypothetical protein